MIPKIIHQIWYQGWNFLPANLKQNVDSVAQKNPDWQIMKWDEDSLKTAIASLGQEYLDKFNNYKLLHQKVDFSRYCILYIYGGASVDTDVEALKGFYQTPHINDSDLIVSYASDLNFINNATILSSKNNPIMKGFIDNIKGDCGNVKSDYLCIRATTGPAAFSKYMNQYKDQITVLDHTYLEPCVSMDKYCSIPDNAILNHKHELSWLKPWQIQGMNLYFYTKHHKQAIFAIILLIIIAVLILNNL